MPVSGKWPYWISNLTAVNSSRYCFGAPYVCNELAGNTVSAGAFAHPAFLKEHHFQNLKSTSFPLLRFAILLTCRVEPLFLSCADADHTFDTASRRRAIDILQEDKKPYQVQLFSGVEHGFALRGNMDNPYERQLGRLFKAQARKSANLSNRLC